MNKEERDSIHRLWNESDWGTRCLLILISPTFALFYLLCAALFIWWKAP